MLDGVATLDTGGLADAEWAHELLEPIEGVADVDGAGGA